MVTPAAVRKTVAHLVDAYAMSERRACKTIGCCRMTIRYQTTRADDAGLRQRVKAIAQERRLSLSETQSCWQLISNRAMLLPLCERSVA